MKPHPEQNSSRFAACIGRSEVLDIARLTSSRQFPTHLGGIIRHCLSTALQRTGAEYWEARTPKADTSSTVRIYTPHPSPTRRATEAGIEVVQLLLYLRRPRIVPRVLQQLGFGFQERLLAADFRVNVADARVRIDGGLLGSEGGGKCSGGGGVNGGKISSSDRGGCGGLGGCCGLGMGKN